LAQQDDVERQTLAARAEEADDPDTSVAASGEAAKAAFWSSSSDNLLDTIDFDIGKRPSIETVNTNNRQALGSLAASSQIGPAFGGQTQRTDGLTPSPSDAEGPGTSQWPLDGFLDGQVGLFGGPGLFGADWPPNDSSRPGEFSGHLDYGKSQQDKTRSRPKPLYKRLQEGKETMPQRTGQGLRTTSDQDWKTEMKKSYETTISPPRSVSADSKEGEKAAAEDRYKFQPFENKTSSPSKDAAASDWSVSTPISKRQPIRKKAEEEPVHGHEDKGQSGIAAIGKPTTTVTPITRPKRPEKLVSVTRPRLSDNGGYGHGDDKPRGAFHHDKMDMRDRPETVTVEEKRRPPIPPAKKVPVLIPYS
jgi:hypothetical protein